MTDLVRSSPSRTIAASALGVPIETQMASGVGRAAIPGAFGIRDSRAPRRRIPSSPTPSAPESRSAAGGSVFWLPDHPMLRAFPGPCRTQWLHAQIVPGYSDGLAPDSHRLPAGSTRFIPAISNSFSSSSPAANLRFDPVPFVPPAQALRTRGPLGITLHRRWFFGRLAHGSGPCNRRRARLGTAARCVVRRKLRWCGCGIDLPLFENAQSNRWFAETISDGMGLAIFVLAKLEAARATRLWRDHEESAERRRTRAPVGKSSDDGLHSTTEKQR